MKVDILLKQDFYQHTKVKQTKQNVDVGSVLDKCIQIGNTALTQYLFIHWMKYIFNIRWDTQTFGLVKVNCFIPKSWKRRKETNLHINRTAALLLCNKDHCYSHSNLLHQHVIYYPNHFIKHYSCCFLVQKHYCTLITIQLNLRCRWQYWGKLFATRSIFLSKCWG